MNRKYGPHLKEKDIVGKTNGSLTVLSLDDVVLLDENGHKCWNYKITVQCENCKRTFQSEWRLFRAKSRKKTKGCRYCFGELAKNKAVERTGFTSEQRKRIAAIKSGAKNRNIPFELSDEDIISIIEKPCEYCGKPHAGGIDRVDSMKGYNINNVVPCCAICNRMKNNYTLEFFKDHIKSIYKKFYEN